MMRTRGKETVPESEELPQSFFLQWLWEESLSHGWC